MIVFSSSVQQLFSELCLIYIHDFNYFLVNPDNIKALKINKIIARTFLRK